MDEDLRPISDAISTPQPSKRVKRTELLMDVTLLVEKKIMQASTEINESNVVSKGYRDTIAKTTTQLMKDEKELADWTQLLADLELEVEKPGTGSSDPARVEAMKNFIADNKGCVSFSNHKILLKFMHYSDTQNLKLIYFYLELFYI